MTNTFLPKAVEVLLEGESISELIKFNPSFFQVANEWGHFKTLDGVIFSCRLNSECFPNIDPVIDVVHSTPVRFSPRLREILDRSTMLAEKDCHGEYVIQICIEKNSLTVRAGVDFRQFEESCDVDYQGNLKFLVNPELLGEILDGEAAIVETVGTRVRLLLRFELDNVTRFIVVDQ